MSLEIKRWLGRASWCGIAVFFGWVALCVTAAAQTILLPGLPSGVGLFALSDSVAAPLYNLLNWGVPGVALATGTLIVLARERLAPVDRVIVTTSAVIALTAVVAILGNSFCREVLGTASLADGVWWMFHV